jgi:Tfp pilus assembly protein PilN
VIAPNLASHPHLNTRPVWLVTVIAGALALIFAVVNLTVWVKSSRSLEEQIRLHAELEAEHRRLSVEVDAEVDSLKRVPWRSLAGRVSGVNTIIREHEFSWIGLLDDIERVLPYDVRLTKISPKVEIDSVNLSFTAIGRTRDALLELLDNFIADPSFSEPTPSSEVTPEESGGGYFLVLSVMHHPEAESP